VLAEGGSTVNERDSRLQPTQIKTTIPMIH
jgi:hypothetical protein